MHVSIVVSVSEVSIPWNHNIIYEKAINDFFFDLNVKFYRIGEGVSGQGLWKVSMWASANSDGSGTRIGYVDQVKSAVEVICLSLSMYVLSVFWGVFFCCFLLFVVFFW